MIHIRNILYILYCGGSIKLIFIYINSIVSGLKIFKKNLSYKKTFESKIEFLLSQNILKGLKKQNINYNIPFLYEILKNQNLVKKDINALIVGCFEGHSTLFFLMHTECFFYCVDNWDQEKLRKYSVDAEGYFDQNINEYQKRVNKIKKTSVDFFQENNQKFDLIYLDGSHDYVEHDCLNAFESLRENGVMIINSVFWRGFQKLKDNNLFGIIKFLNKSKKYKILFITRNTLFLKKL